MNEMALDAAYRVWRECQEEDVTREERLDHVLDLAQYVEFSNWHIIAITGAPETATFKLNPRPGRNEGGRFNPASLPLLIDVRAAYGMDMSPKYETRTCARLGTSGIMISKLTGVPKTTVYRWLSE